MLTLKINVSRTILMAAVLLAAAVFQIRAAVTVDQRGAGGAADNVGLASLTWSHTVGNGATRALLVGVSTATTTVPASLPANRVQSVTYGGAVLTRVGTVVSGNTLNAAEIFILVNPPTTTANVVATFSSTIAGVPVLFVNQASGNSVSFFGISPTAPIGTFASATGNSNSPTLSVTDSVTGDFVFDTLAISPNGGFTNAGANQTVCTDVNDEITCTRGRRFFNNAYDVGAASTEPGASPLVTMSWMTSGTDSWALGAIAVKQSVATAGEVTISGRVTTSAGRGVARGRVTITDANGVTRSATTNFFGYYRLADIGAGRTYILNAFSKQYSFNPQVVAVNEDVTEMNFIAR